MSNPPTKPTKKTIHGLGQKTAIGTNVLLTTLLAGAIMIMLNYMAYRHAEWFWPPNWFTQKTDYRFDWTRSAYYKLSDKTKEIARKLTKPVQVIMFFKPTSNNDARLMSDLQNLMKEYENLSKNIKFEVVDIDRDPMAAQLIQKHAVTTANTVAVLCGDKKKYLSDSDIMEFSGGGGNPWQPEPPKATAFKGEQAITSAILSVTEEKQRKVYFLTGHGEKDPESFDEAKGYSTISNKLKQDNMLVEKLKLTEKHEIPKDCDVLVIAGPAVRLTAEEVDLVGKFIENRGRVIAMLDPMTDTALEPLMEKWNVRLDNDLIMMRVSILGLREGITFDTPVGDYGQHPIVNKIRDLNCFFPRARSLDAIDAGGAEPSPDKPKVTWLVKSPDKNCWGETDFKAMERREAKFDEATDKKTPLTMAVAVERGGNVSGVDVGSSRMVVIGTSNLLMNKYVMEAANSDFFLNAVNWLLQREDKIAISPKTPEEFKFALGPRFSLFSVAVLLGIPGIVTIIGIGVWMNRRK
ncbi:MAG: GldG family protein [Verrucomicrobia bacterium]|nr:GldG family protein [Verrucomicrobiota bacterium]